MQARDTGRGCFQGSSGPGTAALQADPKLKMLPEAVPLPNRLYGNWFFRDRGTCMEAPYVPGHMLKVTLRN